MSERSAIRIGLLFSTAGPYATIGCAMRNGSILAIDEINADPTFPFTLEAIEANPEGRNTNYAEMACRMLTTERLVHVVGCYTSSSRKEVLPYFEKYDGLLWYPSHYGVSRAANTSSIPGRHPTNILCRWPNIF